jgi:hypothetical protein
MSRGGWTGSHGTAGVTDKDANLLGGVAAPVGDLTQPFSASVLEKSHFVAGMFKLVDVSPDLRLPCSIVRSGFAATGATSVENQTRSGWGVNVLQFKEYAAHLLNLFIRTENVLVA